MSYVFFAHLMPEIRVNSWICLVYSEVSEMLGYNLLFSAM